MGTAPIVGTATIATTFICNPKIPLNAPGGNRFPLTRGRSRPVVMRTGPRMRIPEAAIRRSEHAELAPVLHLFRSDSGTNLPKGG